MLYGQLLEQIAVAVVISPIPWLVLGFSFPCIEHTSREHSPCAVMPPLGLFSMLCELIFVPICFEMLLVYSFSFSFVVFSSFSHNFSRFIPSFICFKLFLSFYLFIFSPFFHHGSGGAQIISKSQKE